ncbi:MAG: sensor histidine kinase, partial [Terriglobia bacterium]
DGERTPEGRSAFHFAELRLPEMARYFFPMPGKSWRLQRSQHGEGCRALILDAEGRHLETASCPVPGGVFSQQFSRSLMGTAFTLRNEWSGRVFLFDVQNASRMSRDLAFFHQLVREAAPAVHSAYLLGRLRFRARAIERARIARDLHDGVIQSLITLEMEVGVLRRQPVGASADAGEKLESVSKLLREEVIKLRELIDQLKVEDSAPRQLVERVAEMTSRFQRETGIRTSFSSDFDVVALPPRVSREVVQIVHEALTNARKHSGARHVQVRLISDDGFWKLVIEDDGKGFEFSGRLTHDDLDIARTGPLVIKERTRSIDAELAIESQPSHGSRLEIQFVPKAYG